MEEEPKANSKHTLCGYAWGDVSSSLQRTIGIGDMGRAQRWAAELICSDQGLGRLEAILFHTWAIHVGANMPSWCKQWLHTIQQLRNLWVKCGEDIKAMRNTPLVRQIVAESVAMLVLSTKHHFPTIPTSNDIFREAETMKAKIRAGAAVEDQMVTRNVWTNELDGEDLKTIGNEIESAIKTNKTPQTLFWIVWLFTLELQEKPPIAKERGPSNLSVKHRKSIVWFLVAVLHGIANEANYLPTDDREGIFQVLGMTWMKLGSKGRRDCIVTIALSIQDHIHKKTSISLTAPIKQPDIESIRVVSSIIDPIYAGIAEEARRFVAESPKLAGLKNEIVQPVPKLSATDKLSLSYSLIRQ